MHRLRVLQCWHFAMTNGDVNGLGKKAKKKLSGAC